VKLGGSGCIVVQNQTAPARAAGDEADNISFVHEQRGVACGERALPGQRLHSEPFCFCGIVPYIVVTPGVSPVVSLPIAKDSVHRIAQEVAVLIKSIQEHRVPEAFGVWVGEEEGPGAAGVGGFVEAGEVAFAGGHDDGGGGVEGLDAAEVELLGVGWGGAELPGLAVV
jgi:hypothetical protein